MGSGRRSAKEHFLPDHVRFGGKTYTRKQWKALRLRHAYKRTGGRCSLCSEFTVLQDRESPRFATVDHIVPLTRGGHDQPSNWQLCCVECNKAKADGGEWSELVEQLETRHRGAK